ncbi:MAG: hypothetical protein ACXVDD_20630 [Polyangia bacterium]
MSSKWIVLAFVALTGCTRQTPLPAALVADDAQAVFDTVEDAPFSERVFTFTNDGDEITSALAVQLSGDVHAFQIVGDECSGATLKPKLRCSVSVHLASDDPGEFAGELHVSSEFVAAEVVLSGKVTPAQLVLEAVTTSQLDVVQGQQVSLQITVSNGGGARTGALQINAHSLPVDAVRGDCAGRTLAGGGSCTLELTRAVAVDAALGPSSGTLDVAATPGGDPSMTVMLNVLLGGTLAVDGSQWGTVPTLGHVERVLKVFNPGPLTTGPIKTAIGGPEQYPQFYISADACAGRALAPKQSCGVTVSANLYDTNTHTATLTASADHVRAGSGMLYATGMRAHYTVHVTVDAAGSGTGKVQFSGNTYSGGETFYFSNKTATTPFTALPDNGSTFTGWTGTTGCSGTGPCSFVGGDNSDLTLTATFTH